MSNSTACPIPVENPHILNIQDTYGYNLIGAFFSCAVWGVSCLQLYVPYYWLVEISLTVFRFLFYIKCVYRCTWKRCECVLLIKTQLRTRFSVLENLGRLLICRLFIPYPLQSTSLLAFGMSNFQDLPPWWYWKVFRILDTVNELLILKSSEYQ